eukprot:4827391-Alexandrium_andersonii.AAC.1
MCIRDRDLLALLGALHDLLHAGQGAFQVHGVGGRLLQVGVLLGRARDDVRAAVARQESLDDEPGLLGLELGE